MLIHSETNIVGRLTANVHLWQMFLAELWCYRDSFAVRFRRYLLYRSLSAELMSTPWYHTETRDSEFSYLNSDQEDTINVYIPPCHVRGYVVISDIHMHEVCSWLKLQDVQIALSNRVVISRNRHWTLEYGCYCIFYVVSTTSQMPSGSIRLEERHLYNS